MKNDRGGIISNLFIIPAGIALLIGVFLLGYYVGRYQGKGGEGENASPLPEVVSEKLPKPEEFTFFKTLTEKENKTVSIDLKAKPAQEENKAEKKQTVAEGSKDSSGQTIVKNKTPDVPVEKKSAGADTPPQTALKRQPSQEKKETAPKKQAPAKLRYTVQVASYPERQLADDEARRMKGRGYAAFVVTSDVPGKGTWYRVRLGSFTNKASAEKLAKEIRTKAGVSSIITLE
jgi:cell division septation protein DedD